MGDELVTIAKFAVGQDASAHIAKMQLESNGVDAIIIGENLITTSPYCNLNSIELQVRAGDAEQAKNILTSQRNQQEAGS